MYDLILQGGMVFDGFGTPGRTADVAVRDGRVARVGSGLAGRRVIDVEGQAFAAGAFGFSTGLEYVPGAFAGTDELIALGHVARRWNGTYATHLRSESEGLADALDEAITVARAAGIRLQVSPCKPCTLTTSRRSWPTRWSPSARTPARPSDRTTRAPSGPFRASSEPTSKNARSYRWRRRSAR
ncbi:hypothetical protein GCM10018965_019160 [Nonomuraea roseola]